MILSRVMTEPAVRALRWAESACPLCHGEAADVAFEAQDPSSRSDLVFCVVKCRDCGLHFTNPRPDEESIARFYPSDYKPHHRGRSALPSQRMWRSCPERRGELPVESPGRLLDFGCGGGNYLERMAARGWQVTGLDFSEDAVRRIRREMNLNAFVGTLPHDDFAPCSFDAITMWHSLEHVHDPLAVLRSAFRLLVPGGIVLVACPNIASWPARWFGANWFGLDLPRHLTHFTDGSLKELLAIAGFEIQSVRGMKHSDWLKSSAGIAIRRGHATTLQRALQWKPAAKLAAWLIHAVGVSDSVLAIGRRPE